jgi:hypothetical protein
MRFTFRGYLVYHIDNEQQVIQWFFANEHIFLSLSYLLQHIHQFSLAPVRVA